MPLSSLPFATATAIVRAISPQRACRAAESCARRVEDAGEAFRQNRRFAIGDLDHEFGILDVSGKIYRLRIRTMPWRV